MKTAFAMMVAVATLAMVPTGASAAAPCKDAHGKFVACTATATKPAATKPVAAKPAGLKPASVKPTPKPAASTTHQASKPKPVAAKTGSSGTCRDAHGRFAKCGSPGAHKA